MKYFLLFITGLSLLTACKQSEKAYDLIISNTTIVDPNNRRSIPAQTIYIQNDSIAKIEKFSKSNIQGYGSITIDGTGKFAVAGFWNMHTHVCWKEGLDETLFPTLLSYGITGVRDMGGDTEILNQFKKKLSNNPSTGPELYGPGPLLDGRQPIHPDYSVALTEQNYQRILDSLYNKDIDFLKVYSLLPKELVKKIAVYSKDRNIPFAGHVSEYMTPTEAANLGQKSFEHLNRIEDIRNDTLALNQFMQAVKANNGWLCPTLIIYKRKIEIAQGKDLSHPLDTIIDNYLKNEWIQVKERREGVASNPDKLKELESIYTDQKQLVKKLYANEIPFLIGSDFGGMAFIYPGYGFHEEMELLQNLGFNTYDILKMATFNPALYFGITNTHGDIEKGKVADIVILNKNPVSDIRNTLDISMVIKSGRIFESNK